MNCNLWQYLEMQIVECCRIARSCNEGTPAFEEWLLTAQALQKRQKEHIAVCRKCKQSTSSVSNTK